MTIPVQEDRTIQCPYCGESMDVFINMTISDPQEYVEDCQVCCQPILMRVNVDDYGVAEISAIRENG
jgi:transcription elongation factor Elf1